MSAGSKGGERAYFFKGWGKAVNIFVKTKKCSDKIRTGFLCTGYPEDFSDDLLVTDGQDGANVKIQNDECQGVKFYRFQPYCEEPCFKENSIRFRGDSISPDSLWFSTPQNLNDPMDIDHPIEDLMQELGGSSPVLQAMAKVMYADGQQQIPRPFVTDDLLATIRYWSNNGGDSFDMCHAFRERLLQLGVACFTPSWNNPPMWAHYASNWKGFAIEYCVHQIEMAQNNNNNTFWQLWVNYSSRIEQTSLSELLLSPYEAARRILSAKTLPWSYENEWRLIHLDGGDRVVDIQKGMRMTGIILGPKSLPEQDQLFRKKCSEWGLSLQKVNVGLDKTLHLGDLNLGLSSNPISNGG